MRLLLPLPAVADERHVSDRGAYAEFFKNPKDLPPGEVATVSDSLALPADIPVGQYVLSLAVVDEAEKPVVRLGIKGRAEDGWYPVSKLAVK